MHDPDLPAADNALQLLSIARAKSPSDAALLLKPVAMNIQNNGTRSREVETAQSDAWVAVNALLRVLEHGEMPPQDLWEHARNATGTWRSFLV